jgi:predicted tellurium resistance membrane protein TerC
MESSALDVQAADLLTVALLVALEGLLSADNAMVLAVLVLGLPRADQRKALRYGIVGAFAFRFAAILAAAYLIRIQFLMLIGAAVAQGAARGDFVARDVAVLGHRRQGGADRHRFRH